ncbi:hypothetical protein BH23BAC4_BH23BAC4_05170 [soil metagenome]
MYQRYSFLATVGLLCLASSVLVRRLSRAGSLSYEDSYGSGDESLLGCFV